MRRALHYLFESDASLANVARLPIREHRPWSIYFATTQDTLPLPCIVDTTSAFILFKNKQRLFTQKSIVYLQYQQQSTKAKRERQLSQNERVAPAKLTPSDEILPFRQIHTVGAFLSASRQLQRANNITQHFFTCPNSNAKSPLLALLLLVVAPHQEKQSLQTRPPPGLLSAALVRNQHEKMTNSIKAQQQAVQPRQQQRV